MAEAKQIKNLADRLEKLGLSEKEAKVYVASLFLGPSPVQEIAKQAGINRPTAYVILEQLEEKGLVSETNEQKRTVYVAEDPEAVERWLTKQEQDIKNKKEQLQDILPDLEATHREEAPEAPQVRFYKGKEGIDSINSYVFRKAEEGTSVYSLTNYDEVERIYPEVLEKNPGKRQKKNISSKILYSYSKGDIPTNSKLLRETKKIDENIQADINLHEDKAALIAYSKNPRDLVGILIESPEIVQTLRHLFELAWEAKDKKDSKK